MGAVNPIALAPCYRYHGALMSRWESRLERWLSTGSLAGAQLEPLPGDVSPRRYARIRQADGRTVIAAVYPAELASTFSRFIATTDLLAEHRIPVPEIYRCDAEAGVMLLEDAGDQTLYEADLMWESCLHHLREAAALLARIRTLDPGVVSRLNPPLDADLLWRELELTWCLVLEPQGLVGSAAFTEALRDALRRLCRELGEAPPVPCHRDYMARNLMLRPGGRLTVIDHQDLRLGPPGYDLASLLNDSLFPPPSAVRTIVEETLAGDEELLLYRRATVQRTLKIVGTFHRFATAGSTRYLSLVPHAMRRALEVLEGLPETAHLVEDLRLLWRDSVVVEETV
jgi:hypothetical protein